MNTLVCLRRLVPEGLILDRVMGDHRGRIERSPDSDAGVSLRLLRRRWSG